MTRPRKELVCAADTPYYHVVSRCVRRAFLCGFDQYSGKTFEHRKVWIRDRLATLVSVFAIDLCAYSIMANHTHLVLRLAPVRAQYWGAEAVADRWAKLFHLPRLIERWREGAALSAPEQDAVSQQIESWRERLCDLSWFMRCLNEYLARRANAEDECTGRFWEGRFRSRALLDERALLTAMAYVDLNPIRANLAETPETSTFTSVHQRIQGRLTPVVCPFLDKRRRHEDPIPIVLSDYLALVDWTGRAIRDGKRGSIPKDHPTYLERLALPSETWLKCLRDFETGFYRVIGPLERIHSLCQRLNQHWLCGLGANRRLYSSAATL